MPNHIHELWFHFFFGSGYGFCGFQFLHFHPFAVQGFDLFYSFDRQRIVYVAVWQNVPHQVSEDVFLDENGISFFRVQDIGMIREMLEGIQVGIQFIVETAFQSAALTTQFGLVNAEVLIPGDGSGYTLEIRQPGGAAEFSSAGADSTNLGRFLSGTDLFHLHFYLEFTGVYLDQFTKIHPVVGGVKECGFPAIRLEFHLTNFHLQVELPGHGSGAGEGIFFPAFAFLPFLDVHITGAAQDFFMSGENSSTCRFFIWSRTISPVALTSPTSNPLTPSTVTSSCLRKVCRVPFR